MKVRNLFAGLAVVIVLLPVVLVGLLAWIMAWYNPAEALPEYDQLPSTTREMVEPASWEMMRSVLAIRPVQSEVLIFSPEFRLIWGSPRLTLPTSAGRPLSMPDSIRFLRGADANRDIVLYQLAGTSDWVVQIQPATPRTPVQMRRTLVLFGVFLLVVLVLSVVVAVLVGRSVAASIVRLEKAARRISQGDLASPVEPQRGSQELQSLGAALETMRAELKEQEAKQNRFVMGVSHDLKTPLALIRGYVELLKDGPAGTPQDRQHRFDLILDKADHLDAMIDQLIDFSKVNTDDWRLTWKPLRLVPFLEEFCAVLAPDAQLLHRTLTWSLDLPADAEVIADHRSVRRCLENLVHNALRYIPEGGTVGVQATALPHAWELTVWDNGPGIAPEDLPHLFDPFYRGTHSRREEGLGLGLSVVKSLLDTHGWTIRAESSGGARFVVTIPHPAER